MSATLGRVLFINHTLFDTHRTYHFIHQHILLLLSVCCYVSSFLRTARGLLLDTPLLQTRPSDGGRALTNVHITEEKARFQQLRQEARSPQRVNSAGAECWVFMGYPCSTAQFPSIQTEIFIQILMCTLGSLSHKRLLLDHENNSKFWGRGGGERRCSY